MNPILPVQHFIPDVEARQWADGRMYIYGSYDLKGNNSYCSSLYHVYSSDDLLNWIDHGETFHSTGPHKGVPWSNADLYAPDCIYKDGIYYLYFCLSDGTSGVATSLLPQGPFTNAKQLKGISGIDPGVFIDDDGKAYIYWGQFDQVRMAELKSNMYEIDESTIIQPLSVAEHHFHEGSSLRKRGNMYYMVYTDTSRHGDRPTCLGYATSTSPIGPYTYRGVIVDNYGCDPAVWNNHGCIAEFNGNWFVFYHRSSRGGYFSRRVCVEPIGFSPEGWIEEVEMSSHGIEGIVSAASPIKAEWACLLSGNVRIDDCYEGGEQLIAANNGDYAVYKNIDFDGRASELSVRVSSINDRGRMEFRIDDEKGPIIAECLVPDTGGWDNYVSLRSPVASVRGVHPLYLKFIGNKNVPLFSLKGFSFVPISLG